MKQNQNTTWRNISKYHSAKKKLPKYFYILCLQLHTKYLVLYSFLDNIPKSTKLCQPKSCVEHTFSPGCLLINTHLHQIAPTFDNH